MTHLIAVTFVVILSKSLGGNITDVPPEILQHDIFGSLPASTLSAICQTQKSWNKLAIPQLKYQQIKTIIHQMSTEIQRNPRMYTHMLLRSLFKRDGDYVCNFHHYFIHDRTSDLSNYLKLFLIDPTMHATFFIRSRMDYLGVTPKKSKFVTNFNEKLNSLRASLLKSSMSCFENYDSLKHKFAEVTNNEKYHEILAKWGAVDGIIGSALRMPVFAVYEKDIRRFKHIWRDVLVMIKKDILKILMMDKNYGYDVKHHYNHHWILLLDGINTLQQMIRRLLSGEISNALANTLRSGKDRFFSLLFDFETHLALFYNGMKKNVGYKPVSEEEYQSQLEKDQRFVGENSGVTLNNLSKLRERIIAKDMWQSCDMYRRMLTSCVIACNTQEPMNEMMALRIIGLSMIKSLNAGDTEMFDFIIDDIYL